MTNEAVLIIEYSPPIPMTVTNATGIERGALLTLSDPLTAAAVSDSAGPTAGICAEEKIASDGRTKAPVYRDGVFKVTASGAISVGDSLVFDNGNVVSAAPISVSNTAGIAFETAADTETFLMELRPNHPYHS